MTWLPKPLTLRAPAPKGPLTFDERFPDTKSINVSAVRDVGYSHGNGHVGQSFQVCHECWALVDWKHLGHHDAWHNRPDYQAFGSPPVNGLA